VLTQVAGNNELEEPKKKIQRKYLSNKIRT
jgi:hypothetical protein